MTKRERYLKALHNEKADEFVWAPNFDYWLIINRTEGTLPEKYRDMSRDDIVRAVGGAIWNRADGLKTALDGSVKEITIDEGSNRVHEFHTPLGKIREVYAAGEKPSRTKALVEHFIKDRETLDIMKYVVEATHYEADYQPTLKALDDTGDDGIVLNSYFCVPFIQFAKTDAGYLNGFYLWTDYREKVDSLLKAYSDSFLQGYRVLADGCADVIATGDNMDGTMISPLIFSEYAVPFYHEVKKVAVAGGKLFEGHWCGRTQNLLRFVPECGLDIVEAIVTKPMADITLPEALDLLKGRVVLQGGIPAVMVCPECCTRNEFDRYVEDVILPLKDRKGFILGMSDNVPPNADFSRIEAVAGLIDGR